jgi:hypothetical protein
MARFISIGGALFMDQKHLPSSEWAHLKDIWSDEYRAAEAAGDEKAAAYAHNLLEGIEAGITKANQWYRAGGPAR